MPILTDQERLGTTIGDGRYRLESVLGRGGMGTVFEAVHEWTGRRVAVKLLRHDVASDVDASQRVLQEARSATAIGTPFPYARSVEQHQNRGILQGSAALRAEDIARANSRVTDRAALVRRHADGRGHWPFRSRSTAALRP